MTLPSPPSHVAAPLGHPVLEAAPPLSANDGPAGSRLAGVGSGLGYGIGTGVAAALAASVVFACSLGAMSVVTSGSGGNLIGGIALVTIVGAIVAIPIGLVVGGILGVLLVVTRAVAFAPWLAACLAALVGGLLGQLILTEANGGVTGSAVQVIFIATVALFGACGWFAGRTFARAVG